LIYHTANSIVVSTKISDSIKKYLRIYDDSVEYPLVKFEPWLVFKHPSLGECYAIPKFIPDWIMGKEFPNFVHYRSPSISTEPRTVKIKCHFDPRNKIQQEGLNYLLGEGVYDYMKDRTHRFLAIQTGEGKTYEAFKYLSKVSKVGLVLVHQTSFVDQWINEEMVKLTDIDPSDVGIISGKASIRKLIKEIKEGKEYKLFIGIYRTFSKALAPLYVQTFEDLENVEEKDRECFKELKELIKLSGIGVRFNDEAHLELKTNLMIDSFFNFEKTIDLSATPRDSKNTRNLTKMQSFHSDLDTIFGYDTNSRRKAHAKALFIKVDSKPEITDVGTVCASRGISIPNYGNYVNEKSFDLVYSEIYDLLKKLISRDPEIKIAIILPSLALIERTLESLRSDIPEIDFGNYSSLVKVKDREKEKYKDIFVTTHKSFTEGKNSPITILINIVPYGEGTAIEQVVGRLRPKENKKSLYIEIVDVGFDKMSKQMDRRRKHLLSNALITKATIVEVRN